MKLTGQCKIDFEKWYLKLVEDLREDYHGYHKSIVLSKFYREIPSMQYGVIVDFFDANDIIIEITLEAYYQVHINKSWQKNNSDTLHEAREKAVEAANNIYNEKADIPPRTDNIWAP